MPADAAARFSMPNSGVRIDNGNHLLLSGNTAALGYVRRIGALDTFEEGEDAAIPFVDLATGERWAVRPSRGAVPWWILSAARRVPGTRAGDYLAALRLRRARPADTVAAVLSPDTALFRRLWEPVTVAALNTAAEDASARLLNKMPQRRRQPWPFALVLRPAPIFPAVNGLRSRGVIMREIQGAAGGAAVAGRIPDQLAVRTSSLTGSRFQSPCWFPEPDL